MMRIAVLVFLVIFAMSGCRQTQKDVTGIVEMNRLSDGTIEIVWTSVESADYEVLSAQDPDTSEEDWKVEAAIKGGPDKTTSWTDVNASASDRKLYRVRKVSETE